MNIREEIDKIREEGYNEANAEARLCQDILLKAISESRKSGQGAQHEPVDSGFSPVRNVRRQAHHRKRPTQISPSRSILLKLFLQIMVCRLSDLNLIVQYDWFGALHVGLRVEGYLQRIGFAGLCFAV